MASPIWVAAVHDPCRQSAHLRQPSSPSRLHRLRKLLVCDMSPPRRRFTLNRAAFSNSPQSSLLLRCLLRLFPIHSESRQASLNLHILECSHHISAILGLFGVLARL
ncbi:hypothetical protein ACS0TY_029421 [Phlomoides rotata]